MAKTLTKVDQFKGVINSQTIKAQVYNSFKDKEMAGRFSEFHDRPVFR